MADARLPLTQSLSFGGSSSTFTTSRTLKRRYTSTSELDFFAPAANSFNPRPYTPSNVTSRISQAKPSRVTQNPPRALEPLALPPTGMDPSPSEPNVLFIHPPFKCFPDSDLHPDGLSYTLMAENPEWFLDAADFISPNSNNPQAIPYPPFLEPPRGWCPAKKRDLKERGSEGWPEGEEPRLRCTFCRRTYAGVNAKSMWRRHVFEKHKIAMSNRRDSNDRPRGRGSNKENRQLLSGKIKDETHDNLVSMDIGPQSYTDLRITSHKSRFRSLLPAEEVCHTEHKNDLSVHSEPVIGQKESTFSKTDATTSSHPLSKSSLPAFSPPLTPHSLPSSDVADGSFRTSDDLFFNTCPAATHPAIPPSPYNPLLTPTFRHSPPSLPSDQPWRFPSPSHPLHSRSRELFLSTLARDTNSPAIKTPSTIATSPAQATSLLSPPIVSLEKGKMEVLSLETPKSSTKLRNLSPTSLSKVQTHLSITDRIHARKSQAEESPLTRNSCELLRNHEKTLSELTDDWLSDGPFVPPTPHAIGGEGLLTGQDPFVTIYSPWGDISCADIQISPQQCKPPVSSPVESPVLRNSALPMASDLSSIPFVGLGPGLLEPFPFHNEGLAPLELECGPDGTLMDGSLAPETAVEIAVKRPFIMWETVDIERSSADHPYYETTPPLKKRRKSVVQD